MSGFEVRVDCPSCLVEGARLETWDSELPSCRLGVPQTVECKLCGHAAEGTIGAVASVAPGDGCPGCGASLDETMRAANRCPFCGMHASLKTTNEPIVFADPPALERALVTWARSEALDSAQDILDTYFVLPSTKLVFEALQRKEKIETTFDVADYLFSSGPSAGGAASGTPAMMRVEDEEAPSTQRIPRPASVKRPFEPRDELLALASVAAADGEANVDDQMVLKRAADRRGVPPLSDHDVRVWRPNEIEPPPTLDRREKVLEEMFQLAWADGQMDESEMRVIKDYARAWGIDSERLREWIELYSFADANWLERFLRRAGGFLFPAR